MKEKFFDIENFAGEHILSGILSDPYNDGYILIIDGAPYEIYEYEEPYKSYGMIQKLKEMPEKVYIINNESVKICIGDFDTELNFEGGKDNGNYDDRYYIESFEVYNIEDNSLIFKGITEDWGLYYPCFNMEYHPENLQVNKNRQ